MGGAVPGTNWTTGAGFDTITASVRVNAISAVSGTTTRTILVYQTAETRVDAPDEWLPVPNGMSPAIALVGAGDACIGDLDISALTGGKAWIRFGVLFLVDGSGTATPPVTATVQLTVSGVHLGAMVGSFKGSLASSSASDATAELTGFLPAQWAQAVLAAFIVTSATGGFRCRLVYRVAESSQAEPGGWQNTTDSNVAGDTERHTGDLALTLGNNQWVQFAIAYSSSSGHGAADVVCSVGIRRV